ncbi:MAG: hypothetical protein ACE5LH_02705 [Fidelibacterota bacterium]
MKRVHTVVLCIFLGAGVADAIPRFAVKNGVSCSTCHVSPTGGGLRNDYGVTVVSMDELPLQKGMRFTDEDYTGMVGDHLRLGADFRLQVLSTAGRNAARKVAFFPMQGAIYAHLRVSRVVEGYGKVDLVRRSPEFWTLLNVLPNGSYVVMGRKIPTYGLRLDDHTSFIRGGNLSLRHTRADGEAFAKEGMPFSPRVPLPAIFEIGLKFSDFFATVSLSNPYVLGSETGFQVFQDLSQKNVTARLEYSTSLASLSGLVGGSVMREQNVTLAGIFGGVSLGRVAWLGEVDRARNWSGEGVASLASYSEVIVEPVQGLNLLLKFDLFDEDTDLKANTLTRTTLGVEMFPLSFWEVKVQARFTDVSGVSGQPAPEYLIQFHTWF